METSLRGFAFTLTGDLGVKDFRLFITEAPDYTHGMVANGSPNSDGFMTLSLVNGKHVHRIECRIND